MKNIVINGPGALGLLLACRLSRLPSDSCRTALLDYRPDRAQRIQEQGVRLDERGNSSTCRIDASADPALLASCDALLLCVKSTCFTQALHRIKPFLPAHCLVVALQNGIAHLPLLGALPNGVAGVTAQGATLLAETHIRHGGDGPTFLGRLDSDARGNDAPLDALTSLLQQAGLAAHKSSNILERIWAKLFVNVGINALTALHNIPNGRLLVIAEHRRTMAGAIEEAMAVAKNKHISIHGDPVEHAAQVCRDTAHNTSSMLQDVRRCRPTEIDAINGAIVSLGRELGIPTPINEELVRRVHLLEQSFACSTPLPPAEKIDHAPH